VVAKLDSRDRFGVVVFDDTAEVVVPCAPLSDKEQVVNALRSITSGGTTDLGGGYLRGLQELRRAAGSSDAPTGGTLLVISDGHVKSGLTDPDRFARSPRRRRPTASSPRRSATDSATTSRC
jgi:Ca-activated chloride channel homolog